METLYGPSLHALDPGSPHPVRPLLFKLYRREVSNSIRRNVVLRIADLIQQLLRHSCHIHAAASAGMLCNNKRAIVLSFDDWITNVGKVGNALPIRLAIAARALRATLNHMSRNRSCGNAVPVVGLPAKLAHHWAKRQRSVIAASRNYNSRAAT